MSTINEKLIQVNDTKQGIKQALINRGIDMKDVPFTEYPEKIPEVGVKSLPLVTFFDFDGTILKEEYVEYGGNATPPEIPEHEYLIFNHWNHSFNNVQSDLNIGAIYDTVDNKTYAFVNMSRIKTTQISLNKALAGTTMIIDWGDGKTDNRTAAGNFYLSHTYDEYGEYVISIYCSGFFSLGQGNSAGFLGGLGDTVKNTLIKIYIGNNISSGTYQNSFYQHRALKYISLSNITNGTGMFYNCNSLEHINFPSLSNTKMTGSNNFQDCYSLKNIIFPENFNTSGEFIGSGSLTGCRSLKKLIIPKNMYVILSFINSYIEKIIFLDNINSIYVSNAVNLKEVILIGDSFSNNITIQHCLLLEYINYIPPNITSISLEGSKLEYIDLSSTLISNLPAHAFQSSFNLKKLILPASLTTINQYIINICYNLKELVCNAIIPPSIQSLSLIYLAGENSLLKIYVPDESVNDYKIATNWVAYANIIYPISELEDEE